VKITSGCPKKGVSGGGRSKLQHPLLLAAVGYFFQAGAFFSIENAKFWPVLANLG